MRSADTYRSERRNAWHEYRQTLRPKSRMPWHRSNLRYHRFGVGEPDVRYDAPRIFSRSKYMPHNGKQEMARRVRQMSAA